MTFWELVAIVFSLLGLLENISLLYNLYSPTMCKTSQSSRTCCWVSTGMPHAPKVSLLVCDVVFHWHHSCLQIIAYAIVHLKLRDVFVCKITKPKDADIFYHYKELDAVTRVRFMYCYNHYNETISNSIVYIYFIIYVCFIEDTLTYPLPEVHLNNSLFSCSWLFIISIYRYGRYCSRVYVFQQQVGICSDDS